MRWIAFWAWACLSVCLMYCGIACIADTCRDEWWRRPLSRLNYGWRILIGLCSAAFASVLIVVALVWVDTLAH